MGWFGMLRSAGDLWPKSAEWAPFRSALEPGDRRVATWRALLRKLPLPRVGLGLADRG